MSAFSRRTLLATGAAGMFAANIPLTFAQGAKRAIGVIGSGNIGGTIGGLWVKAGHPVLFSSRKPEDLKDMVTGLGPLAKAGTVADAIAFADVLFMALPYAALIEIGQQYTAALKGKIVIDASNAVAMRNTTGPMVDVVKEVDANGIGPTDQKYLPGTHVVRAFNSIGVKILAREADRPDPKMPVPYAADDPGAVKVAGELIRDAGYEPVLVGGLKDATKFYYRGGIAGRDASNDTGQFADAAELKAKMGLSP